MSRLVFDIETNGLLRSVDKIHCVVTQDVDSEEIKLYTGEEIYEGLLSLYNAEEIIGHNICGYDIPCIQKFYPKWKYKRAYDTFILSCLFTPDRFSHSLDSYGGGQKVQNEDWSCLTYNIIDRCIIDVIINTRVWKSMEQRAYSPEWERAILLEQEVLENHAQQVVAGVHLDTKKLGQTLECLDAELEALSSLVTEKMVPRCTQLGSYKKIFKKDGDLLPYVRKYFGEESNVESIWISD